MKRMPLPPPRQLPWPLKSLASARTALRYDQFGRMVMTIEHDLLRGLTPVMVEWWFRNIGGEMSIEGQTLNRYLVWHPTDHIHWALMNPRADGQVGVGSRFRIVEAFAANPDFYVDVIDTVIRLDEAGVTLVNRKFGGIEIMRLNHDFIAADGGTRYLSTLIIGAATPVLNRPVNAAIHHFIFTETMGHAWLRHNVEEVGLLEHMVPLLYPGSVTPQAY